MQEVSAISRGLKELARELQRLQPRLERLEANAPERVAAAVLEALSPNYAFAEQVAKDDPRLVKSLAWLKDNYTVDGNPGMPAASA